MGPAQLRINKTFYDKTLIKVNPAKAEIYALVSIILLCVARIIMTAQFTCSSRKKHIDQ